MNKCKHKIWMFPLRIFESEGAPGWLSRLSVWLRLRSWSHGSWVQAPHRALCWQLRAGSLLRILCLPLSLPLPAHALFLSLKKKQTFKILKKWRKPFTETFCDAASFQTFQILHLIVQSWVQHVHSWMSYGKREHNVTACSGQASEQESEMDVHDVQWDS